ncbi:MAG: type I-D CRISPR-associated helicase Cas3' [Blastocatellia bacterium]|nr:type I-D CRISPR-associated helicase Cas3' [Blastocatellia bacterium]
MNKIVLKEIYSRLASSDIQGGSIGSRRLAQHQLKTYQLIGNPDVEVVFNTALTGDGKSLAAYLPALQNGRPTIGLYPTNELSRDQERQVSNYRDEFSIFAPRVCRLSSDVLTEYAETHDLTRQTTLLSRIENSEILLSNPDIYHLIMNGYYLRRNDARDKVSARVVNNFDLIVFDEFHIFKAPQIVSAVNAMLLTREVAGPGRKKFLFLSATPSSQLGDYLERAGINCRIVEGDYEHVYDGESKGLDLNSYRRITHQVELFFDATLRPERTSEHWVIEHAEDVIVRFFRDNPGARCAIILNSVGAVKRCVNRLRGVFEKHGLTLGENTGFSTEAERRESMNEDILIGTSTIDIGVDFHINLLIFEALDSGSFIQRLGRLGRHDGYLGPEGEHIPFQVFQAYALIPKFIHERLFEKPDQESNATMLRDGEVYDREGFFEILRDERVYPPVNDFKNYAQRWGGLQSAHIYYSLGQPQIKDAYADIREDLRANYERAYGFDLNVKLGIMRGYLKGGKGQDDECILDQARSFRGGSELECAVIDTTVDDPQERFKTYELPGLLTNCIISEVLSKAEFEERAAAAGVIRARFNYCRLYLVIAGYREAPARWRFYLNADLSSIPVDRVRATNGFEVIQTESDYQNTLNRHLKRLKLVFYIVGMNNYDARRARRLPQLFPLYPLADQFTDNDRHSSYSVAFGQEALLAETLFFYHRGKHGWIV